MTPAAYLANLADTSPTRAAKLREGGDWGRRYLRRRSHSLGGGEVKTAANDHTSSAAFGTTSPIPRRP